MLKESQVLISVMQIKVMNWKVCMCGGGRGIFVCSVLDLGTHEIPLHLYIIVCAFYFPYGNFHFQEVIIYSHNLF
jgi:hypothetical protein